MPSSFDVAQDLHLHLLPSQTDQRCFSTGTCLLYLFDVHRTFNLRQAYSNPSSASTCSANSEIYQMSVAKDAEQSSLHGIYKCRRNGAWDMRAICYSRQVMPLTDVHLKNATNQFSKHRLRRCCKPPSTTQALHYTAALPMHSWPWNTSIMVSVCHKTVQQKSTTPGTSWELYGVPSLSTCQHATTLTVVKEHL